MELLILIFMTLVGVGILIFIVMVIRALLKPSRRSRRGGDSSGACDSGGGWNATDYTTSDVSDTTSGFEEGFGGGDAGGGGSGGSWGDAGGGDSGDGGGGDGGGGGD